MANRPITNYFSDKLQSVGKYDNLNNNESIQTDVPQGSILGPLLFTYTLTFY